MLEKLGKNSSRRNYLIKQHTLMLETLKYLPSLKVPSMASPFDFAMIAKLASVENKRILAPFSVLKSPLTIFSPSTSCHLWFLSKSS